MGRAVASRPRVDRESVGWFRKTTKYRLKDKDESLVEGISSYQLRVYRNLTAYNLRDADEGQEDPPSCKLCLSGLGTTQDDPVIVEVPVRVPSEFLPGRLVSPFDQNFRNAQLDGDWL